MKTGSVKFSNWAEHTTCFKLQFWKAVNTLVAYVIFLWSAIFPALYLYRIQTRSLSYSHSARLLRDMLNVSQTRKDINLHFYDYITVHYIIVACHVSTSITIATTTVAVAD